MLAIFTVSILMFIAFLYEGYAMYSIIMSTIHIFVEYWAIVYIYRQLKKQDHLPHVGKLFIHGSLIALFISTLAPDRKSTRLNSSHVAISYAVFCLKKKKKH